MKNLKKLLRIIAVGAVVMAGLGGCVSAPPSVGVQVTRGEAIIANPPLLGAGILEVKNLAVTPFAVPDGAVMTLTYDLAGLAGIGRATVDKAFSDARTLTAAAGNDVAAIQATLRVYPGGGDATVVLTVANGLARGSATLADVLKIVHPGVATAYADSKAALDSVAGTLSGNAGNVIRATGQFTLVDAGAADAVFRGEVTAASAKDSTHEASKDEVVRDADGNTVKDEKGNTLYQTITWTIYDREVSLAFSYGVERANGAAIGPRQNKSGNRGDVSNSNNDGGSRSSLQDPASLIQSIPEIRMESLSREVASYETREPVSLEALEQELAKDQAQRSRIGSKATTEYRKLEPLEKEHKALKARFKEADALVKQNNSPSYQSARTAYGSMYRDSGSFAAGYNEAVMAEVMGNLEEAVSLMSALYDATKNPKAANDLNRLKRDLREKEVLQELQ